jgi:nicotinamidase-related amidase
MATAALIVIDMLNDSFNDSRLGVRRDELIGAVNQLVEAFRQSGQPVIWVRQEFAPDLSDAFAVMRKLDLHTCIAGTEGAEFLPGLHIRTEDLVIVKKRFSAFFGTRLDEMLQAIAPRVLVVAGVNTHACVRMTVIDAYQRDYEIAVASDCTASYDQEHHEITRNYIDGRIARFLSNSEIRAMLSAAALGGVTRPAQGS